MPTTDPFAALGFQPHETAAGDPFAALGFQPAAPKKVPEKTLTEKNKETVKKTGANFRASIAGTSEESKGEKSKLRGLLGARDVARGGVEVLGNIFKSLVKSNTKKGTTFSDNPDKPKLGGGFLGNKEVPESETLAGAGNLLKKGVAATGFSLEPTDKFVAAVNRFDTKHPETSKTITSKLKGASALGEIAGTVASADVGIGGASKVKSAGLFEKGLSDANKINEFAKTEAISKALGIQGKKSSSGILGELERNKKGFSVLKTRGAGIEIPDSAVGEGATKIFNPEKANYNDTIHAFNKVKQDVFNEYSSIASRAADEGALVDLNPTIKKLQKISLEPRTSAVKGKATKIAQDLVENFKNGKASPIELQRYIQDLNDEVAKGFGATPTEGQRIVVETSDLLRKAADETIGNATGAQYQAIRDQYAHLKSLENGLTRKFQQELRRSNVGIPGYVNLAGNIELMSALLTSNPKTALIGLATKGLGALARRATSPERFLQKAFKLSELYQVPVAKVVEGMTPQAIEAAKLNINPETRKLLGPAKLSLPAPSGKPLGIPINLPQKTQSGIEGAERANMKINNTQKNPLLKKKI